MQRRKSARSSSGAILSRLIERVPPTRHLVVTGLYRYVRNPMYVAVVSAILGQALILGNVRLLEYGGIVWLLFHLFVLVYEEPTLRVSFGSEYKAFCADVPRWIPRFTAWRGDYGGSPSARMWCEK